MGIRLQCAHQKTGFFGVEKKHSFYNNAMSFNGINITIIIDHPRGAGQDNGDRHIQALQESVILL